MTARLNPDVVESMVLGALDGMMARVPDASASEVLSAVFTLANRTVLVVQRHGADPNTLRDGVMQLWLSCADEEHMQ